MKTLLPFPFLLSLIALAAPGSPSAALEKRDTVVDIPDPQLKSHLVAQFDTSGDGEISLAEAEIANTPVNIANLNIRDLTGISHFHNIPTLNCRGNPIA